MSKQNSLLRFFSPLRETSNLCKMGKRSASENASPISSKKLATNAEGGSVVSSELVKLEAESGGLLTDIGKSWLSVIQSQFTEPYFKTLCDFVQSERSKHTIYPPIKDVFSWTRACRLAEVKVVILGQDPYHRPGQAHGLCFSVLPGISSPPSLKNMYKALQDDIPGFTHPGHGYLMGWAQQGVLLLNAVLTVRKSNANSHKNQGWEEFTSAVIRYIDNNMSGVVFIFWGSYAQKKGSFVNEKKHCVLKGVHPSPLSAHRGFFTSQHFSKANAYLESQGKTPIDWSYLPVDA